MNDAASPLSSLPTRRHVISAITALGIVPGSIAVAQSTSELIMFRKPGCPWCVAWDREIGPVWPKTEIGQRFPIRMLDITDNNVKLYVNLKNPVVFTPTFVLVNDKQEIGRFEGYPGEHFFWGLIERLVKAAPQPAG